MCELLRSLTKSVNVAVAEACGGDDCTVPAGYAAAPSAETCEGADGGSGCEYTAPVTEVVAGSCDISVDAETCCAENTCNPPGATAGYTIANDAGTTVSGLGDVACAATHAGTATVTCDTDSGDFSITGCVAKGTCADANCPSGWKTSA